MSETRIMDIIELVDKSSRVINLKIRLRMTALQFGIRHSANKPDALQLAPAVSGGVSKEGEFATYNKS